MGHAHGKIILLGEHAVVYGNPAIAIPFVSATIDAVLSKGTPMMVDTPLFRGPLREAPEWLDPFKELISALNRHFDTSALTLSINSTIPIAAGFGSSAAMAAAIVREYYRYFGEELSAHTLRRWIHMAETKAHGTPSGIDAHATTHDHPFLFTPPADFAPLTMPTQGILIISHSNEQGHTKTAVEMVREQLSNDQCKQCIETITRATNIALEALKRGDLQRLGRCLTDAHKALSQLKLTTSTVEARIDEAMRAGALGAKMSGGGLGGAVIALAPTPVIAQRIKDAWETHTNDVFIMDLKEEFHAQR